MRIVLEEGPDNLTIVRLAREIGASVGGLYRYFSSKEALIFELQKQAIADFDTFQVDTMKTVQQAARDRSEEVAALADVVASFIAYPAHHRHDQQRHKLMTAFLASPKTILSIEPAAAIQENVAPLLNRCAAQLLAAGAVGAVEAGDEERRANTLWAALHGLDDFRKRDRLQPEPLQVLSLLPSMLETFLVGWGAERQAAAESVSLVIHSLEL